MRSRLVLQACVPVVVCHGALLWRCPLLSCAVLCCLVLCCCLVAVACTSKLTCELVATRALLVFHQSVSMASVAVTSGTDHATGANAVGASLLGHLDGSVEASRSPGSVAWSDRTQNSGAGGLASMRSDFSASLPSVGSHTSWAPATVRRRDDQDSGPVLATTGGAPSDADGNPSPVVPAPLPSTDSRRGSGGFWFAPSPPGLGSGGVADAAPASSATTGVSSAPSGASASPPFFSQAPAFHGPDASHAHAWSTSAPAWVSSSRSTASTTAPSVAASAVSTATTSTGAPPPVPSTMSRMWAPQPPDVRRGSLHSASSVSPPLAPQLPPHLPPQAQAPAQAPRQLADVPVAEVVYRHPSTWPAAHEYGGVAAPGNAQTWQSGGLPAGQSPYAHAYGAPAHQPHQPPPRGAVWGAANPAPSQYGSRDYPAPPVAHGVPAYAYNNVTARHPPQQVPRHGYGEYPGAATPPAPAYLPPAVHVPPEYYHADGGHGGHVVGHGAGVGAGVGSVGGGVGAYSEAQLRAAPWLQQQQAEERARALPARTSDGPQSEAQRTNLIINYVGGMNSSQLRVRVAVACVNGPSCTQLTHCCRVWLLSFARPCAPSMQIYPGAESSWARAAKREALRSCAPRRRRVRRG